MHKSILAVAIAAATVASTASAAGFYLKEHSVVGQGRAYAGSAAGTDGASAAYFNPAGITDTADQVEVGVHYITPDVSVTNNGTTTSIAGSNDSTSPYSGKPVPNLHLVKALNEEFTLGVAIGAPYGFSNDYGTDAFNRADHIKVDFSTVEVSTSLARKIGEKVSVSFGLMFQSLDIEQDKFNPSALAVVKLKGDSTDMGYVLGIQYKANQQTTIGASYKSQVTHTVDGTLGATPVTAPYQLPDILALGVAHELTDQTRLYADATWYGWSAYTTQPIRAKANGAVLSTPVGNYKNTVSLGLGLEHDYGNGITARSGIHIDPTPTNDTDRTTANPDSDRTWLAFGVSKDFDERFSIDAAYTYIMADDTTIQKAPAIGSLARIRANVSGKTDILSLGLRYKF